MAGAAIISGFKLPEDDAPAAAAALERWLAAVIATAVLAIDGAVAAGGAAGIAGIDGWLGIKKLMATLPTMEFIHNRVKSSCFQLKFKWL